MLLGSLAIIRQESSARMHLINGPSGLNLVAGLPHLVTVRAGCMVRQHT